MQLAHLPVAEPVEVRRAGVGRRRSGPDGRSFAAVLGLNSLAAAAGLVGSAARADHRRRTGGTVCTSRTRLASVILGALAGAAAAGAVGTVRGHRFGERTLARVREQFVERALSLPASVVERAGTGDLTARGTADVTVVGNTLRHAGPELLISCAQALFDPRRGLRHRPAARRLRGARARRHLVRPALVSAPCAHRASRRGHRHLTVSSRSSRPPRPVPVRWRRSGQRAAGSPRAVGRWRRPASGGCGPCSCAACSSRPWRCCTSFPWSPSCWWAVPCTRGGR